MKIVIDASVIIAIIADEPLKPALIKATKQSELIAPASIHWEIGNAFSAMFKRKRISMEQAQQAIAIYQKIPIRYVDADLFQSIKLASELNIYAYDAYLLCCSKEYHSPLLTLDEKIANIAKLNGIKVMEIL